MSSHTGNLYALQCHSIAYLFFKLMQLSSRICVNCSATIFLEVDFTATANLHRDAGVHLRLHLKRRDANSHFFVSVFYLNLYTRFFSNTQGNYP